MGWTVFLLLSLITSVYAAPFQHLPVRSDDSAVYFDNADVTLFPSDSWDHDLFNLDNLTPRTVTNFTIRTLAPMMSSKLCCAEHIDPAVEHLFATIDTQYHYLAVATSHPKYIHSISCLDTESLVITFNDKKAYEHAKAHWTLADGHQ